MKRISTILVAVALVLSLLLTGCGGTAAPAATPAASTAASAVAEASAGALTTEPVTLKFWSGKESTIEDLSTNEYIKWLQKTTNVKIEFEQTPADGAGQKFALSLASGSYPDVYYGVNQTTGANMDDIMIKFGMQGGVFIALNDLIDKYGVETQKLFSQVSYIKSAVTSPDGKIYALPSYSEIYHVRYAQKMWISNAWLTKLNLKMPTTTDEFATVLKAFKDKDPNGNGKADEIPLVGGVTWHGTPDNYLMCAFINDDGDKRMTVENGVLDTIVNKPAYKEGLKYINKLYKDGLIYEASFTQTGDQAKQLGSQDPQIVGAYSVGAPQIIAAGGSPLYSSSVTVPPLKGPNGVQTTGYYVYGDVRKGAYMITSACKNPDVAFKLADFMYTQEASITLRQGVKGVDWREAKPGEKTFDGKDAKWKRLTPLITSGGAQNQNMGNTGLFSETNDSFIGAWAVDAGFDIYSNAGIEQLLIRETIPYDGFQPKETLPPITFLPEEIKELSPIETELKKYIGEARAQFLTGTLDIDKDWDAYLANLEKLQMKRFLEIYQTGFTRQYGKK